MMKYVDEYRDPQQAKRLLDSIRATASQRWVLMEVCGGQTHSLLRYGIAQELNDCIELIHGPGCPVCVTPAEAIDFAQLLAHQPATTLVSFGDMMRVPGSTQSLAAAQSTGASTKVVYSPVDAVQIARDNPTEHIVFFAVGFETTAPATALAVLQAHALGLDNFSMLTAHVCVQPAMQSILESPENRVQGFLAAGHVCTVTGYNMYEDMAERFSTPVVVTGFEPVDLLIGIQACIRQLEDGRHEVQNCYERSVDPDGNQHALDVLSRVYETGSQPWRGLGAIPDGGLSLKSEWAHFDATRRFAALLRSSSTESVDTCECQAADVLTGRIRPHQCPAFATSCHPESPLGAPMVSSEGACAAYYRFARKSQPDKSVSSHSAG